ncbi:GspH/FimT family pseudopilin [Congregibacter sp.]|uniref:GspH/FimT family pseudopilin n=1 Tax=Congregibacter sp. TaxID=2744308 RepID=UPI003F6B37A6
MESVSEKGFTLIEIMVALVIASLLVGVGAPAAYRYYETASYREAVRSVQSAANAARFRAVSSGSPWDLVIDTKSPGVLPIAGSDKIEDADFIRLGESIRLRAVTAEEYARSDYAAVRFFPSGSSSGGNIRIDMEGRPTVRVDVDWLLGRVTQTSGEADE